MTKKSWQQTSIEGLAGLTVDAMPAVEVLLLDDVADYLMGAGPRRPPYTVEHGSRVVSALFGAVVNARTFTPSQVPAPTPEMTAARAQIVSGAHDFAAGGVTGISLAVASGPRNLLDEASAVGVMQIFQAWDSVLGQGVELPWRRQQASG